MDGRVGRRTAGVMMLAIVCAGGCANGSEPAVTYLEPAGGAVVTAAPPGASNRGGDTASGGTQAGGAGTGATQAGGTKVGGAVSGNGGSDGGPDGGPASSSSGSASSQGAVSGYFRSLGKHDAKTARQFLSPEYRANFGSETAFAAWVANYRSLSGVTLQAARPPDTGTTQQYARYRDLAQWPVTYSATLKTPSANEMDGEMDRFVLVGRAEKTSPWLILDITTGP